MIRWIQNISISYQRFCRQGQRSTEKYQAERSLWSLSYSEAYLCFMSVSLTDIFIFLAQISCIVWTRSNFLGSFTKSVPDHGRCQQSLKKTYHCARSSIVSQKVDFIWTEILPEYSYHLSINWTYLFCRRHANFSEKARFKFLRDRVSTLDPS